VARRVTTAARAAPALAVLAALATLAACGGTDPGDIPKSIPAPPTTAAPGGTAQPSGSTAPTTASTGPVTLHFRGQAYDGSPAEPDQLTRAAQVMRQRLAALGIASATVTVTPDGLTITVSAENADRVKDASRTGLLRLRPVEAGPYEPDAQLFPGPDSAQRALLQALDCTKGPRPDDAPRTEVAACDQGKNKFLLGPAIIEGTGITGAEAITDNGTWTIRLTFGKAAQAVWSRYTGVHNAQVNADDPGNAVAFVVDRQILSAPTVQSRITGSQADVTGSFDGDSARALATALSSGALPVTLQPS
jgi:preprotein translocase subunit SecD